MDCIQSKPQFILSTKKKYFAYLEFFLLIQGKKNLIAVDRALGACEAP